ncbi:MAG: S8 family serine peptidase [Alphaproteobacteria bacterium]|nr:S8 family serine peptidase [Alphaproteobacteria bacterium]NCQ88748.1 S8 family serine peptidase [Alphaproteobacteria bacterium]NCT07329.1 S8 family serine peptidase [Alphaproteobacteria bacterium]
MTITDYDTSNNSRLIDEERSNTYSQSSSLYVPFQGDNPVLKTSFSSPQNQPVSSPIEFSAPEASSDVKGVPSDPGVISGNFWEQWHHTGTYGLNILDVWTDYTGEGVRVGVLDDGFNYNHSELAPNFRTDLDYDTLDNDNDSINVSGDNHGTNVSQIIAGDDNGARTVGVAFDADLIGVRRGFGSQSSTEDTLEAFDYALSNNFDVFNNSWGISSSFGDNIKINFTGTDTSEVVDAMQDLVSLGRGGLGTTIVFSAGNDRASGQSANYNNYQNSPYTITVGALNENGTFANFSEAGSNLLVTAPGDSLYIANVADTNSASIISGTSFSAPAVSGVVALMYEANANLGYRDVQEILAMSSRQVDANGTGWAGEGWQFNSANNWNGGGLHFSHDYGYGNVDALAAVRMAETWNITQTFSNLTTMAPISAVPALSLPATGTVTTTINVIQDITIEQIIIDLDISHTRAGDLTITLTSPDGTDSILAHRIDNGAFTSIYGTVGIDFGFSSTAHWGEGSAGTWTLTITDTVSGNAGTLNDWSLSFLGKAQSNNDLYVYTNEYAGSSGARTLLSDTDGGVDTINAAAVSTDTSIDLNFGGTIADTIFVIEPGTIIENLYTGDGNDTLAGNNANNILFAGRGNDSITGSAGNDTIDGGAGTDNLTYNFNIADFLINLVDAATVTLTHTAQGFVDTISNIENFIFSNGAYTRAELNSYVAGGGGQGTFVNSRLTLGFTGGATTRVDNTTAGDFTYTGADIGQSGTTNILSVNRSAVSLTATVLQTNAIDTVTIRNDDLRQITLGGFRSLYVDQDLASSAVDVTITNAMRGRVDTGAGNDTINITTSNVVAFNSNNVDTWTINTGLGDDSVVIGGTLTNMFSTIYLGAGNDDIDINNQGNDRVYGEDGDDIINLGNGADVGEGGAGQDTLRGEAGDDILRGGADNDTLYGDAGFDLLEGGAGDDTLYGGDQSDTLFGDDGNDRLEGGAGNDTLRGGNNNDTLFGDDGNDQLYGDAGDDVVYGGLGGDFIRGGDGDDVLYGNEGSDKIYGDNDNDTIYGDAGFDALYGGNGNDTLFGGADNDRLYGQNGNDRLDGGAGSDYLYAGSGTLDILIGGDGGDRLYGDVAAGIDVFILNVLDAAAERIYNFNTPNGDIINLDNILQGYTAGVSDINDFVRFIDLGNGTTDLRVNADGDIGGTFGRAALIYNDLGGAGASDLLASGNLTIDQTF